MENRPPFPPHSRLNRPTSLMQSFPHSKSSPPKRDASRILTPHHNHVVPPSHDVFNTGLLTPQASQNTVNSDAAKSLISPPPEDSAPPGTSRQSSLWTRAGSEPASTLRHGANSGSASKRKRSLFPSLNEVGSPQQPQRMEEASPNPKSRKQTRRAGAESDVDHDVVNSSHRPSADMSPVARKQRQSHAPPPESFEPHGFQRSRTPSLSPTKSRRSPALRSPHADKDKADYIPPVLSHTRQHLSARARSSTPIPPYEPPTERFTPPREVIRSSPRVSKSSKRKKTLKVTIKREPPEIDLSRLPPPSPTDDPLLLHGRPPCPRPPIPINARQTPLLESTPPGPGKRLSPLNRCALDFPLPGIPSDVDDDEDTNIVEQPLFNITANGDDSWSSSDGGGSEQEGEYTGKFRVVHVPTKADPPTSTTKERIEQWGRPISPFPRKGSPIPEVDVGDDESSDLDLSLEQPQFHLETTGDRRVPEALEDAQEPRSEFEVRQEQTKATEISVTVTERAVPTNEPAHENHVEVSSHVEVPHIRQERNDETNESFGESPTYPQVHVLVDISPGDERTTQNGNTPAQERDEAVIEFHPVAAQQENFVSTEIFDARLDGGDEGELIGEEQADEASVDRALSEEPPSVTSPRQHSPGPQLFEEHVEVDELMAESMDAESEGDSSDESDLSVVKIVSDDPWAAARAAAILKQHDWDLVMKAARKNRRSSTVETLIRKARRADLANAGVSKSSSPARSARRSFGVVIDGQVVMTGSPSMTLPELLHEAESGLNPSTFPRHAQSDFRTPSPAPSSFRQPTAPLVIDTEGPREWSRSDWKLLDACFTDARLEVGERWGCEGVLGDVDAVELEDVVWRFEDIFGGAEVVGDLGPAFERRDLLKRVKALQKKQRAGQGAPPTPTLRFSSVSSTPTVPDFTPVHPARRFGVDSTLPMLAAPAFEMQTTPQLPASLMAPRYSHLLEEARSLNKQDGSEPSTSSEPSTPSSDGDFVTGAMSPMTPDPPVQEVPLTPSMGSRMKGFFFSYLPTLKKKTPAHKSHEPARPGLPLPPSEVLERPRGPVITPQPRPLPRSAHPKDLVHLQHPPPPTRIPALPRVPKRLVDLRSISPPPVASTAIKIPERRRSSSGSVKELVSSFEEMDRSREIEARALEIRRQKSAGRLAASTKTAAMMTTTTTTSTTMNGRPVWR